MYQTIAQIKQANADAGHYYFEPATMRFFNSKIASSTVFHGRYFITSEQFCNRGECQPRLYTIRVCHDDGTIDTVGEFQQYETVESAKRAAKQLPA